MGTSQSSYEVSPSKKDMNAVKASPLGIESGAIRSSCITASSCNESAPAHTGRLNGPKAWCAGDPADCFLEVDLQTLHHVTAVATQGNPTGNKDYVIKYKIQYSVDGETWKYYAENYKEVLEGNKDNCSILKHNLDTEITGRYVRIWPTAWFKWPCLRLELYGRPASSDYLEKEKSSKVLELVPARESTTKETAEIILYPTNQEHNKVINTQNEEDLDKTAASAKPIEEEVLPRSDGDLELEGSNKGELLVDQLTEAQKIALFESPTSDVEHPSTGQVMYDENFSVEASVHQPRAPVAVRTDDFKRLLEVKKRLEFESELRALKEEQKVEMRRKKKKVTYGFQTPEMFTVPRRVYAEMWGDSPSDSIEQGLDKSATDDRPMIERGNVGAPLAKLDDDCIDSGPTTRTVITIRTVRTRSTQSAECNGMNNEDDSIIQPMTIETSQSEPDDLFLLFNGFSNEPAPYAMRASCGHLHPADPATQDAMESSFHERLDSIDMEGGSPLNNKRFSGLDLLQTPYDAVSGDDIERLLAWEDDTLPGWTRVKKSRDFEIWKGQAVDGGPPITKAIIRLKDIPYDEARRRITDLNVRKEWDRTFDDIVFLERTYNFNVVHCSIKKEGVTLALLEEIDPDEPCHACVWCIADYPDNPNKMLRYETMMSGLVIRPIDDGTQSSKVTLICQLKGSISPALKNTYLTGNPEKWIEMLKKYDPTPAKPKHTPSKTPKTKVIVL